MCVHVNARTNTHVNIHVAARPVQAPHTLQGASLPRDFLSIPSCRPDSGTCQKLFGLEPSLDSRGAESSLDAGTTRPFGAMKAKPLCAPPGLPSPCGPSTPWSPLPTLHPCSAAAPGSPSPVPIRAALGRLTLSRCELTGGSCGVQAPNPWHLSLTRQGLRLSVILVCECPGFCRSA